MPPASAAAARARSFAGTAERHLRALPPVPALGVLVALQLAGAAWVALKTPHNGWIWYSGGDATEYWTEQWSVGHLMIPQSIISYGLPVLYAWVPLVAGPTLLTGAAVIVLLQVLVLVPLALVFFWLLADRLFGRVYAWFAVALWVAGPWLLLHGFIPRYHPVFEQLFLAPHWFGLTNMADLPSLVAVLACAWLTLRAVDTASSGDAILAGLLYGLAIGLKPANGFFLPAVAVLLLGARRPRQIALWAAGLVPAVVTLGLWKLRGLGYLPLTSSSYEQHHVATGAAGTPLAFATSHYLQFDWHHLQVELVDLHEVFWSLRFLEFLLVAGAFGVIRKAPLRGTFIVVWFVSYGIFKGSNPQADFTSANWFRLSEPGLPAYVLLVVGIAYCVPGVGRRAASVTAKAVQGIDRRRTAIAVAVLGLVPLAVVAVAQPASSMRIARDNESVNEAPLSPAFQLHATVNGGRAVLTWRTPAHGSTQTWFQVYASEDGDGCLAPSRGANECLLKMSTLERVRGTRFVVQARPPHAWYRIGLLAAYKRSIEGGDLMLLSHAVEVR